MTLPKESEISIERRKFLKGRPPIYIFGRGCPAVMDMHNSIKKQTEDILRDTMGLTVEKIRSDKMIQLHTLSY